MIYRFVGILLVGLVGFILWLLVVVFLVTFMFATSAGVGVSVLRMIWFGVVIWFRLDLDLTLSWVFGFGFRVGFVLRFGLGLGLVGGCMVSWVLRVLV